MKVNFNTIVLVCGGLLTIINLVVFIVKGARGAIDKHDLKVKTHIKEEENDNEVIKKITELNMKLDNIEGQIELQADSQKKIETCFQNLFRTQARQLYYECVNRGGKITDKELDDITEAHDIYGGVINGNHYFDDIFETIKDFEVIHS